jgi:predicted PhzF superfamily epimerase YddE/YHI9
MSELLPNGRRGTPSRRQVTPVVMTTGRAVSVPQVASTGLPYLIVPVQSGLERARISHPGFEGLLDASGAKFVYVLDPDRPEGRTWDNAGRVEDVATGSAAGPAAGYLLHHGVRPAGSPCWSTRAGSLGGLARSKSAPARTAGCGSAGRWRQSRPAASTPI